jgi:hypothetical protein
VTAPVELGAGALDEALKTLVGVHAHWYAVFEIVVVTVTVEGPGAGAAEVTGAELVAVIEEDKVMREEVATDDVAAAEDEMDAAEETGAAEEVDAAEEVGAAEVEMVLTNRPPMMLELLLAPLTAFFR